MTNPNEKYLWQVPDEDADGIGVLLADRIGLYVDTVNLIDPFRESDLRAANYDLHVGNVYYENDERVERKRGDGFLIPANGLVYVETLESFNLPYYMIARYSLRVAQVYRGLLIDNGLQIDPGYRGTIWVPVHNLVDQERILKYGEPFLTVDFTRTTPLPSGLPQQGNREDLISFVKTASQKGVDGRRVQLFTGSSRTPEFFWDKFRGELHKSSLLGLEEKFDTFKWMAGGTVLGLILAVFVAVFPWASHLYLTATRDMKALEARVEALSDQVTELSGQLVGSDPAEAVRQPASTSAERLPESDQDGSAPR